MISPREPSIFTTWASKVFWHDGVLTTLARCDSYHALAMGLLPDTQIWGLRMRRECQKLFSTPPRVSDPDIHHGKCVTHVPRCMPGSLTSGFLLSRWREKRSRHGACATRNFAYLVRGPFTQVILTWQVKGFVLLIYYSTNIPEEGGFWKLSQSLSLHVRFGAANHLLISRAWHNAPDSLLKSL